jgi:hypothetical protein
MVKVDLEELKAAIGEMEARGKPGTKIGVEIKDRRLILSCDDRGDNGLEAVLYDGTTLGAQFRMTHRLMFMKDKKSL